MSFSRADLLAMQEQIRRALAASGSGSTANSSRRDDASRRDVNWGNAGISNKFTEFIGLAPHPRMNRRRDSSSFVNVANTLKTFIQAHNEDNDSQIDGSELDGPLKSWSNATFQAVATIMGGNPGFSVALKNGVTLQGMCKMQIYTSGKRIYRTDLNAVTQELVKIVPILGIAQANWAAMEIVKNKLMNNSRAVLAKKKASNAIDSNNVERNDKHDRNAEETGTDGVNGPNIANDRSRDEHEGVDAAAAFHSVENCVDEDDDFEEDRIEGDSVQGKDETDVEVVKGNNTRGSEIVPKSRGDVDSDDDDFESPKISSSREKHNRTIQKQSSDINDKKKSRKHKKTRKQNPAWLQHASKGSQKTSPSPRASSTQRKMRGYLGDASSNSVRNGRNGSRGMKRSHRDASEEVTSNVHNSDGSSGSRSTLSKRMKTLFKMKR